MSSPTPPNQPPPGTPGAPAPLAAPPPGYPPPSPYARMPRPTPAQQGVEPPRVQPSTSGADPVRTRTRIDMMMNVQVEPEQVWAVAEVAGRIGTSVAIAADQLVPVLGAPLSLEMIQFVYDRLLAQEHALMGEGAGPEEPGDPAAGGPPPGYPPPVGTGG